MPTNFATYLTGKLDVAENMIRELKALGFKTMLKPIRHGSCTLYQITSWLVVS